jgi:hypothetical protein
MTCWLVIDVSRAAPVHTESGNTEMGCHGKGESLHTCHRRVFIFNSCALPLAPAASPSCSCSCWGSTSATRTCCWCWGACCAAGPCCCCLGLSQLLARSVEVTALLHKLVGERGNLLQEQQQQVLVSQKCQAQPCAALPQQHVRPNSRGIAAGAVGAGESLLVGVLYSVCGGSPPSVL